MLQLFFPAFLRLDELLKTLYALIGILRSACGAGVGDLIFKGCQLSVERLQLLHFLIELKLFSLFFPGQFGLDGLLFF